MRMDDLDARWHELAEDVMTGMKEWRQQHPKATFREIEAALDDRLARLRARMLEDAPLVSRAAEAVAPSAPDKPKQPWRPAANHPWRKPVVLKTKRQLAQARPSSKL